MDYDETAMPENYDSGRSYAPRVLERWLTVIAASIGDRNVEKVLDLGCGTGRYSGALADRFDAQVYAIDPSEKMLEQARRKQHPRVRYERSAGERLPLPDESVDLVFMSMVFHHFDDPVKVARECSRVLRHDGSVCLRAGTLEQVATYPQLRFFRAAWPIFDELLVPADRIVDTFRKADLACVHHEVVESRAADNWSRFAEKVAYRADSVLSRLDDGAFFAGLEDLRRFARAHPDDEPVIELIDLFVFRHCA